MENEFTIRQILERYSISNRDLAFHLNELEQIQLDQDFIAVLIRMFEDESCFPVKELNSFSLNTILEYIGRTHVYYVEKKLPEIEQSIELLLQDYADNHPLLPLLRSFYADYKEDLSGHIKAEDNYLLPYIEQLIALCQTENIFKQTKSALKYTLREFIQYHSDTEGDLQQVRETTSLYKPPVTNQTPYRVLLFQLEQFEMDLRVHALIEDKILIPRALMLETKLAVLNATVFSKN